MKVDSSPVPIEELYTCHPKVIWRYLKQEHISFWMICGYLFFEYIRPQSIYTVIDIVPWSTIFILGALGGSFTDKEKPAAFHGLSVLMALYGLVVLLSSVFAYHPSLAFDQIRYYFDWLIIYFVIVRIVRTPPRVFIFFLLYMLCNFKMSQHGFLSWMLRGFSFTGWGVTGSPGWFQNSGEFGIQLTIFFPLSVAFIFAFRDYWGKWTRIFFYTFPHTAVGSVVATSSRGALVGVVATAAWAVKSTKYFVRTVIIVAIFGAVVYAIIPPESMARFEASGSDQTSRHRLDRWEQSWEAMLEHPFLGVGHRNWDWYFEKFGDTQTEVGTSMVHNIFFESGTEHGFFGLGILVLILLTILRMSARIRKLTQDKEGAVQAYYYLSLGMDGAVVGMVISSSFISVLYYPYVWVHAAFAVCLYNATLQSLKEYNPADRHGTAPERQSEKELSRVR